MRVQLRVQLRVSNFKRGVQTMTLSNLKIENIKPEIRPKKYTDGGGLYLHVFPNGSKYWRLRYRFLGKENVVSFGSFPDVSLAQARQKREEIKIQLSEGRDPNGLRREQERMARYAANNTFASVAKEWFDLNKDNWCKKYSDKIWSRLERLVFPVIGKKPINEVNGLEILDDIIRKLERDGKTEMSHKLLQNCVAIFRLAFLTRRVPFNPLADMRGVLKPHRSKHLPTIRIDQLPEFLQELEVVRANRLYKLAVRLLLLTFVRQGELRKAKWEYFDFQRGLWFIPAEIMKMRQEHVVPLSRQAIEILKEIHKVSGYSDYLFPAKNKIKLPHMSENAINGIIKRTSFSGKIVAHGFRSLASTTLNELGYSPDVIEKQLAHEPRNQVRAAYNRAEYLQQRAEMMQGWADHIDSVINKLPEEPKINSEWDFRNNLRLVSSNHVNLINRG